MTIVNALLELYPFKSLYIADLDAIQGKGNHHEIIRALCLQHPQMNIWLDAGLQYPLQMEQWGCLKLDLIIGSEGMQSRNQYVKLARLLDPAQMILSLDFNNEGFIGAPEILGDTTRWPTRLIAMSLSRVGSQEGPDVKLLKELIKRMGQRQIIAAGGIRDMHDLQSLKQLGVSGALLASALHDGAITGKQLKQ